MKPINAIAGPSVIPKNPKPNSSLSSVITKKPTKIRTYNGLVIQLSETIICPSIFFKSVKPRNQYMSLVFKCFGFLGKSWGEAASLADPPPRLPRNRKQRKTQGDIMVSWFHRPTTQTNSRNYNGLA